MGQVMSDNWQECNATLSNTYRTPCIFSAFILSAKPAPLSPSALAPSPPKSDYNERSWGDTPSVRVVADNHFHCLWKFRRLCPSVPWRYPPTSCQRSGVAEPWAWVGGGGGAIVVVEELEGEISWDWIPMDIIIGILTEFWLGNEPHVFWHV